MDNPKNQFQIPTSVLENGDDQLNKVVEPLPQEAAFATPVEMAPEDTLASHDPTLARRFLEVVLPPEREVAPDPRITTLKMVAQEFESFRATATEENLSKTALQKVRDLLVQPNQTLEERLLNEESNYNGKIFLRPPFTRELPLDESLAEKSLGIESRRFWYFQGYYYYELQYNGYEPLVISYHVTDEGVYKAVNGVPAPMVPGELDSLEAAARLSRDEVRHKMYPVDDAISDLMMNDGESLDNLDYLDRLKH